MEDQEKKCCGRHCECCKMFLIALVTSLLVVIVYHVGTCFFRTLCAKNAPCAPVAQMYRPQCPPPGACPMMRQKGPQFPNECPMMQNGKPHKARKAPKDAAQKPAVPENVPAPAPAPEK